MYKKVCNRKVNIFELGCIIMCIKLIIQYANRIFINGNMLDNICGSLAIMFFIIDFILHSRYKVKQLIVIFCLGIICLYTSIKTKDYNLLITYLFLIDCINYKFEYSLNIINKSKIYLIIICAIVSIVITLITGNNIVIMEDSNGFYFILGFAHPNTIALLCFWCTVEYSYLNYRNNKLNNVDKNIILINILFFVCFKSKTALIGALIWTGGLFLIKTHKISFKFLKKLGMSLFPITGIMFFAFVHSYSIRGGRLYELGVLIDKVMTGRIRIAAQIYEIYGKTIFGQFIQRGKITWDSYYQLSTITIDGLFVSFLTQIGLIYFVLFSIGIFKLAKREDTIIQLCIILYTYYALSEVAVINGFLAFPLLMMGYYYLKPTETFYIKKGEE